MNEPFLTVKNLTIHYKQGALSFPAVRNVGFSIDSGETLGLVGESGCGKSTLALALMGLLPELESVIPNGHINFRGRDLAQFSQNEWRTIRGKTFAMIIK